MNRRRSTLCLLCLVALVPLLLRAHEILPIDTGPLVAEKYAGWSGVLRLWAFEGWPCEIAPWLNRCILGFEKTHPGVYVQPRFVDAGALATFNDSGILPPDLLLFPPGVLEGPSGLLPLEAPFGVRPALSDCGRIGDATYAVPVAMGGYLWAWNPALVEALPDSWEGSEATLSVPPPEAWRHWGAALLALCSGRYSETVPGQPTPPPLPGLDLGLSGEETPEPVPSPAPVEGGSLIRRLPEGFQFDDDAWRHFINGEVSAMPVTQREVRRLQALSSQGKGPDWQLAPGDSAFTDQLLCLAIVDRPNAAPQQALCREFLSHLLSEDCQAALKEATAFSVTEAASGYATDDPLAVLEASLRREALCAPRCLDADWASDINEIVRDFISGNGEAPACWDRLRDILGKNPNDRSEQTRQ